MHWLRAEALVARWRLLLVLVYLACAFWLSLVAGAEASPGKRLPTIIQAAYQNAQKLAREDVLCPDCGEWYEIKWCKHVSARSDGKGWNRAHVTCLLREHNMFILYLDSSELSDGNTLDILVQTYWNKNRTGFVWRDILWAINGHILPENVHGSPAWEAPAGEHRNRTTYGVSHPYKEDR